MSISASGNHLPPVVLYHRPCLDGTAAAHAVWTRFPDAEFHPMFHGQPVAEQIDLDGFRGRYFILADWSPTPDELMAIAAAAGRVTVYDHHDKPDIRAMVEGGQSPGLDGVWDTGRSGALIAWEAMHQGEPVPEIYRYISDADCWQWKLARSRDIAYWLDTIDTGIRPDEFDGLVRSFDADMAARIGCQRHRAIDFILHQCARESRVVTLEDADGTPRRMLMTCGMPGISSDLGEYLYNLNGAPNAASVSWFYTEPGPDGQVRVGLSLRSRQRDGIAVNGIARRLGELSRLGGGGHPHAAGAAITGDMFDALWAACEPADGLSPGNFAKSYSAEQVQEEAARLCRNAASDGLITTGTARGERLAIASAPAPLCREMLRMMRSLHAASRLDGVAVVSSLADGAFELNLANPFRPDARSPRGRAMYCETHRISPANASKIFSAVAATPIGPAGKDSPAAEI